MRAAQGQRRCTCAVDPSLVNVECKVQNVELWTEKKTSLNAPLILHLPFLCRVRNGFTILYKISPLGGLAPFSVEMTEMSFIFRDPSVRAALPRLLRMTERRRAPLFRPAYRRTPSPKGEGKNRRPRPLQNVRARTLARGIEINSLSLQTNTQKRKNHTFSFFPL